MNDIIEVGDQNELVPTASFPHATFPFEHFNPVQSRIFEFYEEPANILIAAATSAGKTVCAEMSLSHEVRVRGGKGMYLGPLKALSQEKIDDWTDPNHHFSDLKLSICTGDYRLTPDRRQELVESNLILMTSEMLNSRARNFKSENNTWIKEIGTLVVDESHLLTVPGRGDHLEAGIMKLTEINPDCRLIFLSATMPNVKEIAKWLTKITGRKTYILESQYRPCPLTVHYVPYDDSAWKYAAKEDAKVNEALNLVMRHPDDKFLVFSHTIDTGNKMVKVLKKQGIDCEFHSSVLDKAKRVKLEHRFRTSPDLRVVVATSTLAWGCNLPARRVIVLGLHRGLSKVATYDIFQMIGRAGRPRYDPKGDAYILLPAKEKRQWMAYLNTPEPIISQMLDDSHNHRLLAFHVVSEIHHGQIETVEDIHKWYDRSLAAFQQRELDEDVVDKMVAALKSRGIIREEDGKLQVTATGMISSMFYYSPFDVADLKKNFRTLLDSNKEKDDHWIAMALANIDSHRGGIVSNAERDQIAQFDKTVSSFEMRTVLGTNILLTDAVKKMGFCYYSLLNGTSNPILSGTIRGLQYDFPRLAEVLSAIEGMSKWGQKEYVKDISRRIVYGVDWDMLNLCNLPGIGKMKARRLWEANLRTLERVAEKPHLVKVALLCSDEKAAEICEAASKQIKAEKN